MQNMAEAPREDPRGKLRRVLGPPRRGRHAPDAPAIPLADEAERLRMEAMLGAYHEMVLERIDHGMRAIQRSASKLMGEIATEVWRSVGPEAGENLSERVLAVLARDDSLRGLISHADERYQGLSLRMQRLEAGLKLVADKMKDTHRALVSDLVQVREGHSRLSLAVERLDATSTRMAAKLEDVPSAARLDATLGLISGHLRDLGEAIAQQPEATADRVVQATGRLPEEVSAATHAAVHAAARSGAERMLRATRAVAERVLDEARAIGESVESSHEALAHRVDAVGATLAQAVARDSEAVSSLDLAVRAMHAELVELSDDVDELQRRGEVRELRRGEADGLADIDVRFFGLERARRRRSA